jgi:hypothetical protein
VTWPPEGLERFPGEEPGEYAGTAEGWAALKAEAAAARAERAGPRHDAAHPKFVLTLAQYRHWHDYGGRCEVETRHALLSIDIPGQGLTVVATGDNPFARGPRHRDWRSMNDDMSWKSRPTCGPVNTRGMLRATLPRLVPLLFSAWLQERTLTGRAVETRDA